MVKADEEHDQPSARPSDKRTLIFWLPVDETDANSKIVEED